MFLCSLLLAVCTGLQWRDGCIWECEDVTCEIHGGKGNPRADQAGNPLSSFPPPPLTRTSCAGNQELPRKLLLNPVLVRKGGLREASLPR